MAHTLNIIPRPEHIRTVSPERKRIKDMEPGRWAYGVITVPERKDNLLPRTLASLAIGGFPTPHLFVDGCSPTLAVEYWERFKLPISPRPGPIRVHCIGNWWLALVELYVRNPTARRYALFQDDMVMVKDCRSYLDKIPYPGGDDWVEPHNLGARQRGKRPCYLNLYTACNKSLQTSQTLPPTTQNGLPGTYTGRKTGWYESNQKGKGAVALVFCRAAVAALLTSPTFVQKPLAASTPWHNMDGCIGDSFRLAGWFEMIHWPSLVQHTGDKTTMGPDHLQSQPGAPSFPGENWSALEILSKPSPVG